MRSTLQLKNFSFLISLVFIFCNVGLNAQNSFYVTNSTLYGGSNMDQGMDLDLSHDNTEIIIGGRSFSTDIFVPESNGGTDYWIMKTNLEGDTIWSRQYGGSNNDDLSAVLEIEDGDIYAFGTSFSDMGELGMLNGLTGAWLVRIDSSGAFESSIMFSGDIAEKGIDLVDGGDNSIVLLGESSSDVFQGQDNNGLMDYWVSGVTNQGLLLWTFLYGGNFEDHPTSIEKTTDAGYIVAGYSNSTSGDVDTTKGGFDFFIVKLLINGALDWTTTVGGSQNDIANDIIQTDDGGYLVVGSTDSSDGDVSQNQIGESDVWIVKLNNDGTLAWDKKYGGTKADVANTIEKLSDGSYLISGSSESIDINLTGNKGDADFWMIRIDDSGNITQQMNYGGNNDDLPVAMVTQGTTIYTLGSSNSIGGTLPFTNYPGEDAWLLEMSFDPIVCDTNLVCRIDTLSNQNLIFTESNGGLSCYEVCNIGLPPGPTFQLGPCPSVINEAAYLAVFTDENADFMSVTIQSDEINLPYLVVATSLNCTQFNVVECGFGFNGVLSLENIPVEPNTLYTFILSDQEGNAGNFTVCTSVLDIDFCNKESSLYVTATSLGSPLEGPFMPGEEVSICYELTDWDKLDCNGFQGLVPSFGPGWNPENFNQFGMPTEIDTALNMFVGGFWDWYKQGDIIYNTFNPVTGFAAGTGMPAGWYFTNTEGPPPNGNPDETRGDIVLCTPTQQSWKLCFTLTTITDCTENSDCSISMKTYSDGELGSHVSIACGYDPEISISPALACCLNPSIDFIPDLLMCSGDTISFAFGTNLLGEVNYIWSVINADDGIIGASDGSSSTFSQILSNAETFPQSVTYAISAADEFCEAEMQEFTITVRPMPRMQMALLSSSDVCSGEDITIQFTSMGEGPFQVILSFNGVPDTLLLENITETITLTPAETTMYAAVGFSDRNCIGNATGVFEVTVRPEPASFIDTVICDGEVFFLGDQPITETGLYTAIIPNSSQFGCDSSVNLILSVIQNIPTEIDTFVCPGDTLFFQNDTLTLDGLYTFILNNQFNCDSTVMVDLSVTDIFIHNIAQTICDGNSVIFKDQVISETGLYTDTTFITETCYSVDVLSLVVTDPLEVDNSTVSSDNGSGNGAITLDVKGGTIPYTYLWSNGAITKNIFDLEAGNFTVNVRDANGCLETFAFAVPLNTATKEELTLQNKIIVFPNPASLDHELNLFIDLPQNQFPENISVFNLNGKFLQNIKLVAQVNTSIQLENDFSSGFYIFSFELKDGQRVVKKVIIIE